MADNGPDTTPPTPESGSGPVIFEIEGKKFVAFEEYQDLRTAYRAVVALCAFEFDMD